MDANFYKKQKWGNFTMVISGILLTYTNINTILKFTTDDIWFYVCVFGILTSVSMVVINTRFFIKNHNSQKEAKWNSMSEGERQRIRRNNKLDDLGI